PELYDRARPRYPDVLFDDLAAHLPEGARVVEVGCGTGQATEPLARRGYRIACVELGEALASVARRKLAAFAGVEVVTADFETWEPPPAPFDAVVAFTSFHWLDPVRRYERAASPLREDGVLAVAETHHVLPADGNRFFAEVQADYEAVEPDDPRTKAGGPGPPEAIADLRDEIDASGVFRTAAVHRYLWEVTYTASQYVDVLDTYSGHRALDDARRAELYRRIRGRIEGRGGSVRKTYLAVLNVARRL
ncbi:MAG: class I SAM-dependent methyltransferase, partial [Gaiellaceae bacterium]